MIIDILHFSCNLLLNFLISWLNFIHIYICLSNLYVSISLPTDIAVDICVFVSVWIFSLSLNWIYLFFLFSDFFLMLSPKDPLRFILFEADFSSLYSVHYLLISNNGKSWELIIPAASTQNLGLGTYLEVKMAKVYFFSLKFSIYTLSVDEG